MTIKLLNRWSRKLHRWGAIISAVPLLLVIVSGLLLQVKKQATWVQPATMKGETKNVTPQIEWNAIVTIASQPELEKADVKSWEDIDRVDVRPSKGMMKIQTKSSYEIQVDLKTGEVLAFNYRRSDWIESLHDGSFFSDATKLWVFLPNGLILLGLWFTGAYLWYLPFWAKAKKKRKQAAKQAERGSE